MSEYKLQTIEMEMTLRDSTVLNIGNADIILGSLAVEEASSPSNEFRIGTAIAKRLRFSLNNFDDEFSEYDFVNAVINLRMTFTVVATPALSGSVDIENGILTDSAATIDSAGIITFGNASKNDNDIVELQAETVSIPYGVYYVTEKPVYNGGTIAFNALDCLYKTATQYETALAYPASLGNIFREICSSCGITAQSQSIPNDGYIVNTEIDTSATTYADVLCWVAEVSGGFAYADADGAVGIRQYGDIVHTLDSSYTSEMDTDDITITGVGVAECFDETDDAQRGYYLSGAGGYILPVSGNPLIQQGDAQTVADYLAGIYVGMQFRTMRLTVPHNPTIHVGDAFVYTDRKGNSYGSYATEVTYTTNDVTTVSMGAKSPAEQASTDYTAADRATAEAQRLTSTDALFDKIYARGINCDYLVTGIIKSAVSGFSLNMDTGEASLSDVDITGGSISIEQTSNSPHYHSEFMNIKYYDHSTTATENYYLTEVSSNSIGFRTTYYVSRLPIGSDRPETEDDYDSSSSSTLAYSGLNIYTKNGSHSASYRPYEISLTNQQWDRETLKVGYNATRGSYGISVYRWASGEDGEAYISGTPISLDSGVSTQLDTAPMSKLGTNGVAFTNPATASGQGWLRVTGTTASNTEVEIGAGASSTAGSIVARRYNGSDTPSATLTLMDSSGYLTQMKSGTGSSTSLTSATWKTVANVAHGVGTYLILAHVSFATNTSGARWIMVTAGNTSSTAIADGCADLRAPVTGFNTHCKISMVVTATSSGTWYLRAYQNSGAALNATGSWIQIIRLG